MSWLTEIAAAAVPPLVELLAKLVSGQIQTKDDAVHAVADVAVAAGIADGLVAHLTARDAAATKDMVRIGQAAVYPDEKP